jgi:hypothetical protein
VSSEPPIPTWLVVCCAALLAFVLFGGPLAATLAQSPTPEPSYEELLAEEFGQPDGYEVDRLDLPGHHVNKLVVVRDRRSNVTCYVWGETMVCLNTYEYSK